MSTRAAYGFRHNNKDYISYNHSDGDPTGLGYEFLEALTSFTLTQDIEYLRSKIENITLIQRNNHVFSGNELLSIIDRIDSLGIANDLKNKYTSNSEVLAENILYFTQGQLDAIIDREFSIPYMLDSKTFLYDSLFCEWAYIVNLDEQVIEFYKGFNKNPNSNGRYASLNADYKNPNEYFGVALMGNIPFSVIDSWTKDDIADFTCNLKPVLDLILNNLSCGESIVSKKDLDKIKIDFSSIKDL